MDWLGDASDALHFSYKQSYAHANKTRFFAKPSFDAGAVLLGSRPANGAGAAGGVKAPPAAFPFKMGAGAAGAGAVGAGATAPLAAAAPPLKEGDILARMRAAAAERKRKQQEEQEAAAAAAAANGGGDGGPAAEATTAA